MISIKFYHNSNLNGYPIAVVIKVGAGPMALGAAYIMGAMPQSSGARFCLVIHGVGKPKTAGKPMPLDEVPAQVLSEAWRLAAQVAGVK